MCKQYRNIHEVIKRYGDEGHYKEPQHGPMDFDATNAPPGSAEKIQVMRERLERGEPLWHEGDPKDWSGDVSWLVRLPRVAEPGLWDIDDED